MKRLAAIFAVALALPAAAHAQEAGVGVRVLGGAGSTLYAPVKLSKAFMLEGSVSYLHFKNDYGSNAPYNDYRSTSTDVGVGLFWLKALGESSRMYAGPRVSYGKASSVYGGSPEQRTDTKGFTLAPTLGAEFFPTPHVSIGGEIGVSYGHSTGDSSNFGGNNSVKSTQASTVSSVILRYYF